MKHANLLGELLDFQTSLFRRKRFQFQCAAFVVNEAHVWFVPHKTIEFATSAQTSPLALVLKEMP
ncbi:MAG: hypothetical protein EOP38_29570 [Rubrivivax sp.]|nr:MAG: hypothetical protein EOP38_29570 [Rubrivivax sp.]